MIRPAPPALIRLTVMLTLIMLTLMMLTLSARAFAGPINLLQPAATQSTRVLIDASRFDAEDDAATELGGDCVAVADREIRGAAGLGAVAWTGGRLSWEWDRGREPALVYVMCLDRTARWNFASYGNALGMGMSFLAGAAWANSTSANRARSGVAPSAITIPDPTS